MFGLANTIVQERAPDAIRGRVSAIMGLSFFGVLPFGTSNDFFAALKAAQEARKESEQNSLTLPLDVGHVQFDDVERYFCLTVGIGLFSWANEQYLDKARIFGRRFAHQPNLQHGHDLGMQRKQIFFAMLRVRRRDP